MKETGLTGKRRSTTIAATPDDGKSQRKRRRRHTETEMYIINKGIVTVTVEQYYQNRTLHGMAQLSRSNLSRSEM